ncbi:SprT-like domain-containing protein [Nocardioides jishulii]|uniref:M48 family peptidase n=1 Tax=Nocardioides jishulii TaxID=2575440 RepID=A0A4U2YSV7_9ACTN|nr:SprT-like domain-containing protein [Nocardioides jishulii]QCX28491.1 M48 family peptidase [Nocardioides jishulii]TKI64616.1 M48 family peptidase [Nocardioides jishulii]
MDVEAARRLAEELVARHGLRGWRVTFDHAKRRAGVCRYESRTISLSAPLTRLHSEAEVRDTILHEIAHALLPPREGHSERWRATALRIGSSGRRCVDPEAPRVPGDWVGVCSAGHVVERHRRPHRVASCRECARGFHRDHVFVWTYRGRTVPMSPSYVQELAALRGAAPASGRLVVGEQARIVVPGRFDGVVGTVEKVGRTRYHLRTRRGIVTVHFGGVERAD